jgi:hypothetical protein
VGAYYYLGAQLPYLVYGQKPPMSSSAFKELAKGLMSSSDAEVLDYLVPDNLSGTKPNSKFLKSWMEWEEVLRLNLARGRSQKLKREGAGMDAPAYPADAAGAAKIALSMDTPLEAEIFLDNARWNAIESFQGIDVFSSNAMFAYLLKLLLMERRAAFKTDEGYNEYKGLYAAILGNNTLGEVK